MNVTLTIEKPLKYVIMRFQKIIDDETLHNVQWDVVKSPGLMPVSTGLQPATFNVSSEANFSSATKLSSETLPPMLLKACLQQISAEQQTSVQDHIEMLLYTKVIFAIVIFGLLGNAVSLLVLALRTLQCKGRQEKFSYAGLTALSVANIIFCASVLPHGFIYYQKFIFRSISFDLFYGFSSSALINTSITCSSWLTVLLAIGRYVGVAYPIKARQLVGPTCARWSICAIFLLSIVVNLPWYWMVTVKTVQCPDGSELYLLGKGALRLSFLWYEVTSWCFFIITIAIPLIVLCYCNVHLIIALRAATRQRQTIRAYGSAQHQPHASHSSESSHQATTLILILLILLYVVLVAPVELVNFIKVRLPNDVIPPNFNVGVATANTLQAINFSISFILYFAINAQFRLVVRRVTCCSPGALTQKDSITVSTETVKAKSPPVHS